MDGQLAYEKKNEEYQLFYSYDTDGRLAIITKNDLVTGTNYSCYVITNTRGDVLEIKNGSGTTTIKYNYDAWGKLISATNANGVEYPAGSFAYQNSVRYRGYVYDQETGLYYLQSRYYDPETGRFINADDPDYLGLSGTPLSYNAFAYCENNPTNRSDTSGKALLEAITLYFTFHATKLVLYGLLTFVTFAILKTSGVLDLINRSVLDLLYKVGTGIWQSIDSLKTALNTVVQKSSTRAKTNKTERHHIIAKSARKAAIARNIWQYDCLMDINSPINLVDINYNSHKFLHSNAYYNAVNDIVKFAYKKYRVQGVISAVLVIKSVIIAAFKTS